MVKMSLSYLSSSTLVVNYDCYSQPIKINLCTRFQSRERVLLVKYDQSYSSDIKGKASGIYC